MAAGATFRKPSTAALWIGILTGPLTLAAEQELNFILVQWACVNGAQWVLHLVALIALIIVLIAAAIAFSCWRTAGRVGPNDTGGMPGAARFLALGGLILSLMFAMAIVWHGVETFLIGVCQ